ncbi:MAG: hypothetical protein H7831_07350, partial [Magnetococcus sp. WYHC-3]
MVARRLLAVMILAVALGVAAPVRARTLSGEDLAAGVAETLNQAFLRSGIGMEVASVQVRESCGYPPSGATVN